MRRQPSTAHAAAGAAVALVLRCLVVVWLMTAGLACAAAPEDEAMAPAVPLAPLARAIEQGSTDPAQTEAVARVLLAGVAQGEDFSPRQRHAGGARVLWLRIAPPALDAGHRWHLRLSDVRLDQVTLYRLDAAGRLHAQQAGELVPGSQWTQRTRAPTFSLGDGAAVPPALLLRIENRLPFWLDLEAVDEERLLHEERADMLLYGAYFGVMGFAMLYSLLQFGFTRDRLYGWYALYLLLMAMRQDLSSGFSRSLWLPDLPLLWTVLRQLLLLAVFPAGLLMVRALLPPQLVGLRVYRAGTVALLLGALLALAYPALPPDWSWTLYNAYGLATIVLLGVMLGRAWQPGLRQVHGIAIGFLVISAAALVPLCVNLSWLPPSGWSTHALVVGGMVEAMVLAIALSIGLSDDIAIELARRDRSPRDPATGLHGPALLPGLVHALLMRHRRAGVQAAVIALEVANAQDLVRHHGRETFDAMLKTARRLLAEHKREADVALRLGRHRFALVLTRTAGAHQVLAHAQHLIDRGLRQAPELPPSGHLRLHAVVALLPEHVTAPGGGLLQALHAALDQIRPGSGLVLRELETTRG